MRVPSCRGVRREISQVSERRLCRSGFMFQLLGVCVVGSLVDLRGEMRPTRMTENHYVENEAEKQGKSIAGDLTK